MSTKIVQYAFTVGEISSAMLMRGDVEAYPYAARKMENFFVDYRGGALSRPGTRTVGFARGRFRNISIQFLHGSDVYVILELTHLRARVLVRGAYVTEGEKTVTAVNGDIITIPSHGYAVDDWVLINGAQFRVAEIPTADTIRIETVLGRPGQTAVGAVCGRIYEFPHPFEEDELFSLTFEVEGNTVIFCSSRRAPQVFTMNAVNDWAVAPADFSGGVDKAPTGFTVSPSASSTAAHYVYAVAAVLDNGTETVICQPKIVSNVQMSQNAGYSNTLTWDPVPDAVYYIIYRSREFVTTRPSLTEELGYLGKTYSTTFVDSNILPSFTKTPRYPYNPFAAGAVRHITVTNAGMDYTETSAVSVSGGSGSGFVGVPGLSNPQNVGGVWKGPLGTIKIVYGGEGYIEPVSVSVTEGTGATFSVKLSKTQGNFPRALTKFQQRLVFGGTDNSPTTIFGSVRGEFFNFTYSIPQSDTDYYEHKLDTKGIQYIQHLLASNGGLLVFTDAGVYRVIGDSTGRAVTPNRINVYPQAQGGCVRPEPIMIGSDVLYKDWGATSVRALRFNPVSSAYSLEDLNVLASHIFSRGDSIVDWAFAESPFRLLFCVKTCGEVATLTYTPEQKVFAWSRFDFGGQVFTVAAARNVDKTSVFFGVRRQYQGKTLWCQEELVPRDWASAYDMWCVDQGAARAPEAREGVSPPLRINEDGTFTGGGNIPVGALICVQGVRLLVTAPGEGRILSLPECNPIEWPLETDSFELFRSKVTSVGGLEYLEGEEVSVFADGNVLPSQVVQDGKIDLAVPAYEVLVGRPFRCRLETFPVDIVSPVVQSRRRRHFKINLMTLNARGVWVGGDWDSLVEVKERDLVTAGDPLALTAGYKTAIIPGRWRQLQTVCIEVREPVAAGVLGLTIDLSFGDED